MKRRRLAGALTAAACIAAAIAGCSSGTPSGGGKVSSLTVEDYFTGQPQEGVYTSVYDACGKSLGVKITTSHVPGNALISKVLQQGTSKSLPDVIMLDNPDVPQIASTGAIVPLSSYGVSTAGFAGSVVKVGTYDGKLYGLAPVVNSLGLFYNTKELTAAGISAPPTTWAQLRTDAKKLTKKGQYGFAFGAYPDEGDAWSFLPFMWSNGGDEKDLTGTPTVQAMQFVVDLLHDGSMPRNIINWEQGDVATQFQAGKVAMMINGPWNIKPFEQVKTLSWGTAPTPTRVAGQTVVSPLGGEAYTVANTGDSARMKLAAKLVSCIATQKNQRTLADATGNIPSSTAAAKAFGATDPRVEPFVGIVSTARARTAELGTRWPKAATAIYTAEGLAITGKATASGALKQAQAQENQ